MTKTKDRYFRRFGYNTFRLLQSGLVLVVVAVFCVLKPAALFSLPWWGKALLTAFYAVFPIKDMVRALNRSRYKGKQFAANFRPAVHLDNAAFLQQKKAYDRGALCSMLFWLCFLGTAGVLFLEKQWLVFLAAMSDFCVYFAIFFWCPFHKILLKPHCCMDCRIFNWDSFFSFSFLLFLPGICTHLLVGLGLLSLLVWEINYHKAPARFFKMSNAALACETCDMEHCKQRAAHMQTERSPI